MRVSCVQGGVERLDVAPVGLVLVVLLLEALGDLVERAFGQADARAVGLVDVAAVVAKGAGNDRVVDHLDGGVDAEVDRPLAVVDVIS